MLAVLFLAILAGINAQEVPTAPIVYINYSLIEGPVLLQWWYWDDTECQGGNYRPVVVLPGCNPYMYRNTEGGSFQYINATRSLFLDNCTGDFPFQECVAQSYDSLDCTGAVAFEDTIQTGDCTRKASTGTKFFQWHEYSAVPLTSYSAMVIYNDDECQYHENNPFDVRFTIGRERRPFGQCIPGGASSYRLLSADRATPTGDRICVFRFWDNNLCTGDTYQVIQAPSYDGALYSGLFGGYCQENTPVDGDGLIVHCSMGSFLGASAWLFASALLCLLF